MIDSSKVGWVEIVVDANYDKDSLESDYTAYVPTCKKCSALLVDSRAAIQTHLDWHNSHNV